ncbi:MAG TPA: tRNA uridine-5-carboxymethylaminomethyl(34) synthesis GTPase MnmE [Anaerolineae bacterium]|nr:tRNA uridine-5-carboxymethylaminomethyl(34) synthesis GTPase MnmE [Anaerolineae bacterium]
MDDTIVAISTPVGEGGIGIVRLTGPDAKQALCRLFVPAGEERPGTCEFAPRTLRYGHVVEPATGERVDEVLATWMPAPHTYTRQDVVEINAHGGIVPLRRILALCLRLGARLAEPGEFTARAFLNGRLDLAQAEAVLDVVRAKTEVGLRAAVDQLGGHLSRRIAAVRTTLLEVLAYLEATIDFVEDEIPAQEIEPDLVQAAAALRDLLAEADRGIIYRHGVRTAIVGRPNVGKSSLLNRLLRANRAIVTDVPGTTRDTLEETLNLHGVPIVLVDTAGITDRAAGVVERLGIERSRAALAEADLALLVVEAGSQPTEADRAIAGLVGDKPAILVLNKIDLNGGVDPGAAGVLDAPSVALSALTGEGLADLERSIVELVFAGQVTAGETPAVTNPRHKEALNRALQAVEEALAAHRGDQLPDLVAIDLSAAVQILGEITGQTASDELVDLIFARFCVGK